MIKRAALNIFLAVSHPLKILFLIAIISPKDSKKWSPPMGNKV
jgi:hypothetical protein